VVWSEVLQALGSADVLLQKKKVAAVGEKKKREFAGKWKLTTDWQTLRGTIYREKGRSLGKFGSEITRKDS